MCGIFGYIGEIKFGKNTNFQSFLTDGFITSSLRGHDSAGVVAIPTVNTALPTIVKRPVAGYDFIDMVQAKKIMASPHMYAGFIAHTRAATIGNITQENAHPFCHGHITMVHNGTLINRMLLGDYGFGTDSEYIAKHLQEFDNPLETIAKIDGAYALAWFNRNNGKVYLTRNDERPLSYGINKELGVVVFGSEHLMYKWISERNGIKLDEIYDVKPHTLVEIPIKEPLTMSISNTEPYKAPVFYQSRLPASRHDKKKPHLKLVSSKEESKDLRVKVDDTISFVLTDVYLTDKKSRHATLVGIMDEEPMWRVVVKGVDIKVLKVMKENILTGRVVTIISSQSDWPTLYVANVVNTGKKVPGKHVIETIIEKYSEMKHNPTLNVVKQEPQQKEHINIMDQTVTVDGQDMTRRQFHELVKHGCSACTEGLIMPGDVKLVNGFPFCEPCYTKSLIGRHH